MADACLALVLLGPDGSLGLMGIVASCSATLCPMSDDDLTSLSNEELARLWREAMTEEQAALEAEEDYARQAGTLAQGCMPVMSPREGTRRADAVEAAKECRLAIEAEEQRRTS
jgi:hypothetical protein